MYLVLAYLLVVWVGIRLIVPYFGYRKDQLPQEIPPVLEQLIQQFSNDSANDFDFLEKTYEYITSKYKGSRIKTITNFWRAFQNPVNAKAGFLPCNSQNYLLRLMLVKSGRFTENHIQVRVVPLNFFIHQYLRVNIDGQWINVDPWSRFLNIKLGGRSILIG